MGSIFAITPCNGFERERLRMPFSFRNRLGALLHLWHDQRHPASLAGLHTPEIKAKKSKTRSSLQIDDPALLLVDVHL